MSEKTDLIFKIGIVGPTRVGKTSLVASILKDSQQLLEGSPVSIRPFGTRTEKRIAQHHKDLEGSIRAGEFHPGAVSGTEESFTFDLLLDSGPGTSGIRLSLLDYPGGWIDPARRPEEREKDWESCKSWIRDSSVLIVPVESAVMMEADSAYRRRAVPSILNTHDVGEVSRDWAKERTRKNTEPALLIFCPVKCESYFSDNGGLNDKSKILRECFQDHYLDVLKAVKGEAPHVNVLYAPVDTIGCVEIVQAHWKKDEANPSELIFTADYRVRRPNRQTVKGADAVLISLCQHLIEAQKKVEEFSATELDNKAKEAKDFAEEDNGFFGNIWLWLSRERNRRTDDANRQLDEASKQRQVVENLGQTIARLAQRELGVRVHKL